MTDRSHDKTNSNFFFHDWMKISTEFWKPIISMWAGVGDKVEEAIAKKMKNQAG